MISKPSLFEIIALGAAVAAVCLLACYGFMAGRMDVVAFAGLVGLLGMFALSVYVGDMYLGFAVGALFLPSFAMAAVVVQGYPLLDFTGAALALLVLAFISGKFITAFTLADHEPLDEVEIDPPGTLSTPPTVVAGRKYSILVSSLRR